MDRILTCVKIIQTEAADIAGEYPEFEEFAAMAGTIHDVAEEMENVVTLMWSMFERM